MRRHNQSNWIETLEFRILFAANPANFYDTKASYSSPTLTTYRVTDTGYYSIVDSNFAVASTSSDGMEVTVSVTSAGNDG